MGERTRPVLPGRHPLGHPRGRASSPTADEASGDLLDDAARVTDEANGDNGFQTVTFRGHDTDGELIRSVVVEGPVEWRVAHVDICE